MKATQLEAVGATVGAGLLAVATVYLWQRDGWQGAAPMALPAAVVTAIAVALSARRRAL